MATYTYQNAVDYVTPHIKGIPTSAVNVAMCDMVQSAIWTYFPWRWSLASLTAIALVDGTQDYTIANADFYRLVRARVVRTDTTPDEFYELLVMAWLPPDLTTVGYPGISAIAYEQALNKLRITRAASVPSGTTLQIQGEYQKVPTKIASLLTTLTIPDHYFDTFVNGLLWKCYQFADDPRAGQMTVAKNGGRAYSGAMGAFFNGLWSMAEAEDWGQGDTFFPDNTLGAGLQGNPGFFV